MENTKELDLFHIKKRRQYTVVLCSSTSFGVAVGEKVKLRVWPATWPSPLFHPFYYLRFFTPFFLCFFSNLFTRFILYPQLSATLLGSFSLSLFRSSFTPCTMSRSHCVAPAPFRSRFALSFVLFSRPIRGANCRPYAIAFYLLTLL